MKLAVTGKGGAGKSTLTALMARVLRDRGRKVLLVDADPDMNLASILNIPDQDSITPIVELKELIAERTGTRVGEPAPFFTMNPRVDDIPEQYRVEWQGVRLLVMGTVSRGGGGCACPENAFLKQLLSYLLVAGTEAVIVDMEAGIEHLGRGTALGVDAMVVVVEPSRSSLETARRIQKLAADIGIKRLCFIGNKTRSAADEEFIRRGLATSDLLGCVSYAEEIRNLDTRQASLLDLEGRPLSQVGEILGRLTAAD
jgi:CO dehydrogenase maturation factor